MMRNGERVEGTGFRALHTGNHNGQGDPHPQYARHAWQSYTPTLVGITVGNGTINARFRDDGGSVQVAIDITFGSTTTLSGGYVAFAFPYSVRPNGAAAVGAGVALDLSEGRRYPLVMFLVNDLAVQADVATVPSTQITATAPFAWAPGDTLSFTVSRDKVVSGG